MKQAWTRVVPALALTIAAAGCSGNTLGAIGDILNTPIGGSGQAQSGNVTVEIQQVQESQQQIIVNTQDGQQGAVLYDQNTQVVYQNQQYPVTSLEQGDVVNMHVQQVQQGYYTDVIEVQTPVQQRQGGTTTGPASGVLQIEGTIGQVNASQAWFTLNMTQGGTVTITIPSTASSAARARLSDYRAGDYVRVEVRQTGSDTATLVQWGWENYP